MSRFFGMTGVLFLCFHVSIQAQYSVRVNFGNYSADYGIAYFNMDWVFKSSYSMGFVWAECFFCKFFSRDTG
jgi:hypothetical protein